MQTTVIDAADVHVDEKPIEHIFNRYKNKKWTIIIQLSAKQLKLCKHKEATRTSDNNWQARLGIKTPTLKKAIARRAVRRQGNWIGLREPFLMTSATIL